MSEQTLKTQDSILKSVHVLIENAYVESDVAKKDRLLQDALVELDYWMEERNYVKQLKSHVAGSKRESTRRPRLVQLGGIIQ
jgi:hypothetical protein